MNDTGGAAFSRRRLLAGTGLAGAAAVAAASGVAGAATPQVLPSDQSQVPTDSQPGTIPFHGDHQAGIATPEQARLAFAAFDVTGDRGAFAELLAEWTAAAEQMVTGRALPGGPNPVAPPADTGESAGLPASRLTLTLGYGPTLFDERFGLGRSRPRALVDVPPFPGDQLDPATSGGDVCVQACADDPQVAFHAVHNLARLALGVATVRYVQLGFGRTASAGPRTETPRNLLGFKDGTNDVVSTDAAAMRHVVWVDDRDDQAWMLGGSYLVARRIRIHLEAWDRSTLGDQERTIGRVKASGAPLGAGREHTPVELQALDASGLPLIPDDAHIRVAAPATNAGAAILRRGYSFADGVDRSTGELDAGLFFICFQKDPVRQFIAIQERLARQDALAAYLVHTGSGIFACPPGTGPGRPWGHGLV